MRETDIRKKLIEQAKRKCRITWRSETTDREIEDIVEDTNLAIRRKVGIPKEISNEIFLSEGPERTLWKEHCLYAWSGALEEYDKDYQAEIMQARREYEVKHHESKKEAR